MKWDTTIEVDYSTYFLQKINHHILSLDIQTNVQIMKLLNIKKNWRKEKIPGEWTDLSKGAFRM